jgi:Glycosyltransferase family 87
LREPRRLAAILLLSVSVGLIVAFNYARAENAGADAIAYWHAVRTWLAGGDPYVTVIDPTQASGHILPYAYPPWTLVLFLPWALLPWDVAWLVWRAAGVVLFAWTVKWAYERRPLGTAVSIAVLGPALVANFDSGNINIFLTLMVWWAQFVGDRLGGMLWAFATALKWLPGLLIVVLRPRARLWGLAFLGLFTLLALATWPQTLRQLEIVAFYPRPLRLDYFILAWAAVPWLYAQPWPTWWLQPKQIARHWRERAPWRAWVRGFFGLASAPSATQSYDLK